MHCEQSFDAHIVSLDNANPFRPGISPGVIDSWYVDYPCSVCLIQILLSTTRLCRHASMQKQTLTNPCAPAPHSASAPSSS